MKQIKLTKPGVLAVGQYSAGEVYDIEDDKEAQRLVEHKGFEYVSDALVKPTPDAKSGA